MQPLAVDLRLLADPRAAALRLLPGRGLMARVMEAEPNGRGLINIAGAVIAAELPRHVRVGDELRLVVRQADEHRVVFELPAAAADPTAAPSAARLPGGGTVRVEPDAQEQEGGHPAGTQTVALRYDAPALGALDLRFELSAGALRVTVAATPGSALERVQDAGSALQDLLSAAGDRPVAVSIIPRREPLDVLA
jgi:hypothetical protein